VLAMAEVSRDLRQLNKPIVGKHLVETLTLGMYTDPMVVYREYIQNAADQIDVAVNAGVFKRREDALISVKVGKEKRQIRIEDNATGISRALVPTFLGDVAKSHKDPATQKGFRGIGRLGGLGYCGQLTFITSFSGESTKSIIQMNASRLREIIKDVSDQSDAATVISLITTIREEEDDPASHYFHVVLEDVIQDSEAADLLSEEAVADYLSMVAPVAFRQDFKHQTRIEAHFQELGVPLEEYSVELTLNGRKISKAYTNTFVDRNGKTMGEIIGIDFFSLFNDDEELLACGWYGLTNQLNKAIPPNNLVGGIRLKKNNITIGDENTLKKFFEADRFNLHFVGEVHVYGTEFIPNARRDDFNASPIVSYLHDYLRTVFKRLVKLSRFSSTVHSRYREIKKYFDEKHAFAYFRERAPVSAAEVQAKHDKLSSARKKAELAKQRLEELDRKNQGLAGAQMVYKVIVDDEQLRFDEADSDLKPAIGEFKLDKELMRLGANVRKAMLETFNVLDRELWFWETDRIERLKLKVAETVVASVAK
jgi:hypothetical protein